MLIFGVNNCGHSLSKEEAGIVIEKYWSFDTGSMNSKSKAMDCEKKPIILVTDFP